MRFSTAFRELYIQYSRRDNPMGKAVRIMREDPSLADDFLDEMGTALKNIGNNRLELYVTLEAILYVLTTLGRWNRVGDFLSVWKRYPPERGSLWWWAMKYYEAHLYLHTLNEAGLERLLSDPTLKCSIVREILYLNGKWGGRYICIPHDLNPGFTVYQEIVGVPCMGVWGTVKRFLDKAELGIGDLMKWFSVEGLILRIGGGKFLSEIAPKIEDKIPDKYSHLFALYGNPHSHTKSEFVANVERLKMEVEVLGLKDEYYRYVMLLNFLRKTIPKWKSSERVIRFISKFRKDVYTIYYGIMWRIGRISLEEFYSLAKEWGTLGVFDHLFHLEKLASGKAYLNFTGTLHIYWKDRPVSTRETFLKTRSALVGLAYLLVFRKNRPDLLSLERFLERNSQSLYSLIHRKYAHNTQKLRSRIKKAIREDVSRVQKVFREGKVGDGMQISISIAPEDVPISNSNNFLSAARYGMVLVQEEGSWAEEFKEYALKIRMEFLKDFALNFGIDDCSTPNRSS